MANKNKGLGLQVCKGNFALKGRVTGVEKENFYRDLTTKTGKDMRIVSFGVEYDRDKVVYVSLNGMERDNVYFSSKSADGKTVVETVPWKQRKTFKKEGYKLIGVLLGLVKIRNEKGETVNDKRTLTEYDACQYINDNLKDDMSVFVRGKLEFSEYNGKHQVKYVPTQISLCKDVDFDAPDYEAKNAWEHQVCFMGIDKTDNGEFNVLGKIIGYNSVEDTEFALTNAVLAKNLRSLKPYTAISLHGLIEVIHDVAEEEEDDGWGYNPMATLVSPTIRRLLITGADKSSIDTTIYSEKEIEEAVAKKNSEKAAVSDYGGADDEEPWGDANKTNEIDDDWD